MPDYVQILTCTFYPQNRVCSIKLAVGDTAEVDLDPGNDYGESSYICDTVPDQIVPGAEKYTVEYPHSALRALLPSFIAAFKAGKSTVQPPQRNTAVAWYRTTPCSAGPDGGKSRTLLLHSTMCSPSSRYPVGPWRLRIGVERSQRRCLCCGFNHGAVSTRCVDRRAVLGFSGRYSFACIVLRSTV